MPDTTPNDLHATFLSMPEPIKDAITSEGVEKAMQDVGVKYRLHIDVQWKVSDLITRLMMGMVTIMQFEQQLQGVAGVDAATARNITIDVDKNILSNIREHLHELMQQRAGVDTRAAPATTEHELEPVELGGSTLQQTPKEGAREGAVAAAPNTAALTANKKLEGVVATPMGERVLDEQLKTKAASEEATRKSLYPGGADPYHEPIH